MPSNLSTQDHRRIADAIRAAEARTQGEIYCVVAGSSDSYFFPAAVFALSAIAIASLAAAFALEHWWIAVRLPHFMAVQLLAMAAALGALLALRSLRLRFVPLRLRYRRAHENALKQFMARNIHVTAARTGVLIFVSRAERYAEVVADNGIDSRVPQETWNRIVAVLIGHSRDGRLADGFVEAITAVGDILAEHFPPEPDDRNELDDHLVEI